MSFLTDHNRQDPNGDASRQAKLTRRARCCATANAMGAVRTAVRLEFPFTASVLRRNAHMLPNRHQSEDLRSRRRLLGALATAAGVSAAALLGMNAAGASAAPTGLGGAGGDCSRWPACATTRPAAPRAGTGPAATPTRFPWSRAQTATLLDVTGAGVVTHLWFTINSPDPMHLKNLVLRAWWDGEVDALGRGPHRRLLRPGPGRVFHLPVGAAGRGAHQGAQRLLPDAVCELPPA